MEVGNAAPGGVDKLQLAIDHDVVDVPDKQGLGMQGEVDLHQDGADILLRIKRINAQFLLHAAGTSLGQLNGAAVLRDGVVQLFAQPRNYIGDVPSGGLTWPITGQH